jgi:plasmid rolling circle replication initiator protein Rep
MTTSKKSKEHYVSNKDFLAAMIEYKKTVKESVKEGKTKPRVPDYIGT